MREFRAGPEEELHHQSLKLSDVIPLKRGPLSTFKAPIPTVLVVIMWLIGSVGLAAHIPKFHLELSHTVPSMLTLANPKSVVHIY